MEFCNLLSVLSRPQSVDGASETPREEESDSISVKTVNSIDLQSKVANIEGNGNLEVSTQKEDDILLLGVGAQFEKTTRESRQVLN